MGTQNVQQIRVRTDLGTIEFSNHPPDLKNGTSPADSVIPKTQFFLVGGSHTSPGGSVNVLYVPPKRLKLREKKRI